MPNKQPPMSPELREQLWKDPDWTCPRCGFVNMAIRNICRNFKCRVWLDRNAAGRNTKNDEPVWDKLAGMKARLKARREAILRDFPQEPKP